MLERMRTQEKQILLSMVFVFAAFMWCGFHVQAAEYSQMPSVDVSVQPQEVSDGIVRNNPLQDAFTFIGSVSDNSALTTPDADAADGAQTTDTDVEEMEDAKEPDAADGTEAEKMPGETILEQVWTVDSAQLQTLNYKDGILTDWQQIIDALHSLTPDSLENPDMDGRALVLQVQNVGNIPAGIRDGIVSDDSGYTKYLHCNVGYGASLVFSGASDNSGFNGISNASVTVDSEKRGKKSMAVTVRFASHEDMGTVASLHVNLPQCAKGTKVSVYAETVSMDADGNVTVGENACIGSTKADENGNVEVLIQSTANYMFVYKTAKE